MSVGRTIAAGLLGLLFLLFVALDLVFFGVVPLNSVLVTILPAVGLVLGLLAGILAGKRKPHPAQLPPPVVQSGNPV